MGDRREIKRGKKVSSSVRKARSSRYISNSTDRKEYLFLQSALYSNHLSIWNYFFGMLFVRNPYVFCNALNNSSVDFLDKLKKKKNTESGVSLNICSVSVKKIFLKITKVIHSYAHILSLTLLTVLVLQPGLCHIAVSSSGYVLAGVTGASIPVHQRHRVIISTEFRDEGI